MSLKARLLEAMAVRSGRASKGGCRRCFDGACSQSWDVFFAKTQPGSSGSCLLRPITAHMIWAECRITTSRASRRPHPTRLQHQQYSGDRPHTHNGFGIASNATSTVTSNISQTSLRFLSLRSPHFQIQPRSPVCHSATKSSLPDNNEEIDPSRVTAESRWHRE